MAQFKVLVKAFLEGYFKVVLLVLLWVASFLGGKFEKLLEIFLSMFWRPELKAKDVVFHVTVHPEGDEFQGKNQMTTIVRADQYFEVTIGLTDAYGNAVGADGIDGLPVWSSSDDSIAVVEAAADGLSAKVTPTGKTGAAQVNVLIDAQPGEGEQELVGVLDVTVVSGKATILSLSPTIFDKAPEGGTDPETPEQPEQPEEPEQPVEGGEGGEGEQPAQP